MVVQKNADVKLIGFGPSPYVMRARVALNIKGVKYEFLEETFGLKSDLLLESNPVYKKVPVLLHGGNPICESLIIVEYIDSVWSSEGSTILPADPYDRAITRFWAFYLDDKWYPALQGIMKAQTEEEKAGPIEQVLEGLQLLEGAFEKCSKGKDFFGGDSVGYLDVAFGCFFGLFKAIEKMNGVKLLDEHRTPLLFAWAERFCAEEVVKGVIPDTDVMVGIAKMVQARLKEMAAGAAAN